MLCVRLHILEGRGLRHLDSVGGYQAMSQSVLKIADSLQHLINKFGNRFRYKRTGCYSEQKLISTSATPSYLPSAPQTEFLSDIPEL
jgi:hypothetical protein